jgi:N-methylhydantoinase A
MSIRDTKTESEMTRTHIGLDVGGTFTDVVAVDDESGATTWFKVPTDVASPGDGVLAALAATGVPVPEMESVRIGTTLGVNALLTHSGAPTGLITTRGFRDVLEIRRTHRQTLFDLNERFPEPLVPRNLRLEVRERVDAAGNVVEPLDEDGVRRAWRTLRAAGVQAVAIVFLFSFENSQHEERARQIVLEEGGAERVFISSEVLPAYREYERTSTTVAAARIAGTVETYLTELSGRLDALGLGPGRLSVMTNSGGTLSTDTVARLPIATLLSGPVGGVEASRWLARRAGFDDVLTLDMGGTSCDVSGIVDGIADERLDMSIAGHTISYPTYDIETIGAGGGSIAWIDASGRLRVGPESAGSSPGPACYGRGGTRPTVTDADLVLGRYDAAALLGGSVRLDAELARDAIDREIATPLGMTVEAAAAGIVRIVNILMTNAVRAISVERGRDVRDFTLAAYGGAGPTHAAEIAAELSIPRVLIPPFPGCTSAFGAVVSGSRRDFLGAVGRRRDRLDLAALAALQAGLRSRAVATLDEEHAEEDLRSVETWLDVRYEGQAHELAVSLDAEDLDEVSLDAAIARFHDLHRQLFGHAFEDVPIELVNLRVKAIGRRREIPMWWNWQAGVDDAAQLATTRPVHFEGAGGFIETAVLRREGLAEPVDGPAVIHQVDSTILVPPGCHVVTLDGGSLLINLPASGGDAAGRHSAQVEALR